MNARENTKIIYRINNIEAVDIGLSVYYPKVLS